MWKMVSTPSTARAISGGTRKSPMTPSRTADGSNVFAKAFAGGRGVDEGADGEVGVLEEEGKQVSALFSIDKGDEDSISGHVSAVLGLSIMHSARDRGPLNSR
jgi:hypothetical protein